MSTHKPLKLADMNASSYMPSIALEEEILRREKEVLAGAKPSPLENGTGELEAQTDGAEPAVKATPLTKDQRRMLRQQWGGDQVEFGVRRHPLEISAAELI